MPNHDQKKNNNSNGPIDSIASNSVESVSKHGSSGEINNNQASIKERKRKRDIIQVTVVQPPTDNSEIIEANKIAKEANTIANKSVYINLGLFIGTLLLAFLAWVQYNSSVSALKIAKQTLDSTNMNNHKVFKLQQAANNSADSSEKEKSKREIAIFRLQKTSDSTQIAALQETQKEFEIENKPFLQVVNFKIDTIISEKKWAIHYDYVNLGKQPIRSVKDSIVVILDTDKSIRQFENKKASWVGKKINIYLTQQAVFKNEWKGDPIPDFLIKGIYSKKYSIYLEGKLFYINTQTKKKSKYEYLYKILFADNKFTTEGVIDTTIMIK